LFTLAALSLCLFGLRLDLVAAPPQTAAGPGDKSVDGKPMEAKPVEIEPMEAKIDAIFAPLTDAKSPGFAVLVRKDGRPVFQRGYGARDLRSFAKIDPHTNFRLASFTKQFTAMSIMLLVRDASLRYDTKLSDLFPDFPPYGRAITIRHLLTHTSGLPDYEDLMDAAEARKGAPIWTESRQIQDAEVLQLLKQETAGKFAPGAKWKYSNSGYVVLGLAVAKVSGKPFSDFLRERIFAPLQMSHTVAYQKGKNEVTQRAYGHLQEGSIWRETDQSSTSATLGDGGIYSNLEDLAKWDDALARYTLLSETDMQPALTPATLANGSQPMWPSNQEPDSNNLHPGQPVAYGFGWFLDPYRDRPRMYHHGGTLGFRTYIARFTEDNLTLVVLCNRTDLDPESLALKAADLYLAPAEARKSASSLGVKARHP
jgi:CubicO group peptidase (beta-lactamase class C family)